MSLLRGFGFMLDTQTGQLRNWYAGADGVKRWVNTDKPIESETKDESGEPK